MDHGRRAALRPAPRHARHAPRWSGARRLPTAMAAVPVGLLLSGLLVWQASYAAFVSTTDNSNNTWSTGNVRLSDDDGGFAAFTVSATRLVPGDTDTRCISVTYAGNLDTATTGVRLYGAVTGDAALTDALTLTVDLGTGGSFATCTGFSATQTAFYSGSLTDFGTHVDYGTGVGGGLWVPMAADASKTRTYRVTYRFPPGNYTSTVQDKAAALKLVWEVHSLGTP